MSASDADLHNPFILAIRVVELFERFIGHPSLRRSANTTALSLKSEKETMQHRVTPSCSVQPRRTEGLGLKIKAIEGGRA